MSCPPAELEDAHIVPHTRTPGQYAVSPASRVSRTHPSPTAPTRAGSWILPRRANTVVAWNSREHWLSTLASALATPAGDKARRAISIAPDTLMRVARADAAAADGATGRNVATAHETVATQLGMSTKTVERARTLIIVLGFASVAATGRYLTAAERRAARRAHGGVQLRAASTRLLTLPVPPRRWRRMKAVENVELPRKGLRPPSSNVLKSSPKRAGARSLAAARPSARTKHPRPRPPARPWPLETQRLAADLLTAIPSLLRPGQHIGNLCSLIERHEIGNRGWTAHSLLDAIDRANHRDRVRFTEPTTQRDRLAYFAWHLKRAVAVGEHSPFVALEQERAERLARQSEQAAAEQARRALIEEQRADIDAIIAGLRDKYPSRHRRQRPNR